MSLSRAVRLSFFFFRPPCASLLRQPPLSVIAWSHCSLAVEWFWCGTKAPVCAVASGNSIWHISCWSTHCTSIITSVGSINYLPCLLFLHILTLLELEFWLNMSSVSDIFFIGAISLQHCWFGHFFLIARLTVVSVYLINAYTRTHKPWCVCLFPWIYDVDERKSIS